MKSGDDPQWRVSFVRSLLPILVADARRQCTDVNPAACLFFRLPRTRVLELRLDDLTPPENLGSLKRAWASLVKAGTQAGSHEFLMPDGQRVRVAYSATVDLSSGRHIAVLDPQRHPDRARDVALQRESQGAQLTRREREILALVAMGQTGPAIARELHISLATVETHIRHCLEKLGANNRPHAVLLAIKRGEISLL